MAEGGTKTVLCRYFLNGACRDGDNCHFSHDRQTGVPDMICRYYLKGMCAYGDRCRFDHTKPAWMKKPQETKGSKKPPPSEKKEDVKPKSEIKFKNLGAQKSLEQFVDAPEFVPRDETPKSYAEAAGKDTVSEYPPEQGSELCPYLIATGTCPYNEACEHVHGDCCDMCGMFCLHPYDPHQRKQHEEECIKMHELDMEHSFRIARSKGKTCGICMDVVLDKSSANERRFGILPNCNHIFCLPCIRKWRQAKQFENKIIRACPECRVTSDYVCPSKYWVDDQKEKTALLEDYRKALGKKPCKHFREGRGTCPFGNKCFYLHAKPDGTKVDLGPPKRRKRQKENGTIELHEHILLWDFIEERENRWLFDGLDDSLLESLLDIYATDDSDDSDTEDFLTEMDVMLLNHFNS